MPVPKLADTQQAIAKINFKAWLQKHGHSRQLSLRRISLIMGKSANYLYNKTKQGDFSGADLVYLGNLLHANPFDQYSHLINTPTRTETTQAARIAKLETLVSSLEKERDIYKEISLSRR